jgi:TolB protein
VVATLLVGLVAACGSGHNRRGSSNNPCGSAPKHVTNNNPRGSARRPANNNFPAWSPDECKIGFVSDREGESRPRCIDAFGCQNEIYVMNADGSDQHPLTRTLSDYGLSASAWSPDGRQIVFQSSFQVYVVNTDGSHLQKLKRAPTGAMSGNGLTPNWSPDGRRIAFAGERGITGDAIFLMDADGKGQTRLTRNPNRDDFTPAWSPDGRKIAFSSAPGDNFHIYVVNTDGSKQRTLMRQAADDILPAWSPDGREIAFARERGNGKGQLYAMNADGSNQHRLTRDRADNSFPAWSPDGRKIAFASERGGTSQIYVMNADGSNQRPLTYR